jgi:hypothetical protein
MGGPPDGRENPAADSIPNKFKSALAVSPFCNHASMMFKTRADFRHIQKLYA